MRKGYPAKAVANYFLEKYGNQRISPLQIQKLVYIAHGWHLALHEGKPLVNDEFAEAWKYGPVFASLYYEFKHIGRKPIRELATDTDLDEAGKLMTITPKIDEDDEETHKLLDRIWEAYSRYSALRLSAMCHQNDSPWDKTRKRCNSQSVSIRNAHIKNEEIEEHYLEKLQRNQNNA